MCLKIIDVQNFTPCMGFNVLDVHFKYRFIMVTRIKTESNYLKINSFVKCYDHKLYFKITYKFIYFSKFTKKSIKNFKDLLRENLVEREYQNLNIMFIHCG